MRFAGDWKDVGTWNTMAEVMAEPAKGHVIMDETCANTNIVNELDIPILAMGCKDLIIAAGCDGILVAEKERSSQMKPYVEKLDEEIRYAEKSWGSYTVIDSGKESLTIKVHLTAGSRMKYHSHQNREEIWTVLDGVGRVVLEGVEMIVTPGSVVNIRRGQKHQLIAESDMHVVEVQVGKDISKADKETFESPVK